MVSKCANPTCEAEFRFFGKGRLLVSKVTRGKSQAELFWVCDDCEPQRDGIEGIPAGLIPLHRTHAPESNAGSSQL